MVSYQTIDRNDMSLIINKDGSDSDSGCGYDYDYEEVETLSFCDLPIYSSSGGGASFESKDQGEHNSLTSDYQEDDFFEFLSGDLDSTTTWDIDNVIFCGKLIPYHQTPEQVHQIVNQNENVPVKKQRQRFFQWKSRKSRMESCSRDAINDKKTRKCGVASANNNKKLAAGELILASSTRAKWHLFLFGLTKNPTAIELSGMKNRQHRRTPSSSLKYPSFDETKKGKEVTGNTSTKKRTSSTTSGKGLWKLLKVLCCKNKVSIGGI